VQAKDGTRRLPSGAANEVWSFGEEAYPILEGYLHLREALRPYTRRALDLASEHGQPVLRGLFHEFPDDPHSWTARHEYLFGPDLLVAPVVEPGARSRRVHLPAGTGWTYLPTGKRYEGGEDVTVDAPLAWIPVFARDGAEVPDLPWPA
jgi:alpha-D-xyloside xylohydrolase